MREVVKNVGYGKDYGEMMGEKMGDRVWQGSTEIDRIG